MSAEEHGPGADENHSGKENQVSAQGQSQVPGSPRPQETVQPDTELSDAAGAVTPEVGSAQAAAGGMLPDDLPALPGQNSDLTDAGAALGAGSSEVVWADARSESQRALSVASARRLLQ